MKNLIRISFAGAALFALLGAQVAGAQTVALSVTGSGGDRNTATANVLDVQEGDRITVTVTPTDLQFSAGHTGCLSFTGSATAGTDFAYTGSSPQLPVSGQTCTNAQFGLNFSSSGPRSREYLITDDATAEGAETIMLTLSRVLRVTGGGTGTHATITVGTPNSISVNILASDAATASIARAGSGVVAEGQSVEFTVSLSNPSQAQVTVSYTVANADTAGTYNVASSDRTGTVVFATGETSKPLTLNLPADASLSATDSHQTLTVAIPDGAAGVMVGDGGGTVTRTTDTAGQSADVEVSFADRVLTVTGPETIAENDSNTGMESGNYTVALSGTAFAAATTVTWTVTDGTTTADDFVAATDRTGTVMFGTSDTSQTFTLTVAGDLLNEAGETFTVQVSGAGEGVDYGLPAMTTITDNDAITATVSGSATVNEGGVAELAIALSVATSTAPVEIAYAGDDDTGAASVTIPTGMNAGTLRIPVTDDNLNEADELLNFTAAAFTAESAGTVTVSGNFALTIAASDPSTITLSGPASIAETDTDADHTFTLTRTGGEFAGAATVTVAIALDSDAATADAQVDGMSGSDAAVNQPSIVFAAGEDSKEVTVAITGDNNNEAAEVFTLATSGGARITHAAPLAVTITDNDRINLALGHSATDRDSDADGTQVNEGDSVQLTAALTGGALTDPVTLRYRISGAGITAGDYHDPNGGLVTLAASSSGTVNLGSPIAINVDAGAESAETLTVTITAAGAHAGAAPAAFTAAQSARVDFSGSASQAVTINANTAASRTLAVTVDQTMLQETDDSATSATDESQLTVTVTPSAAFTADATLNWEVVDGTTGVLSGLITGQQDDFASGDRSGTVNITSADTEVTFTIDINDERVNEPAETFRVRVTADMPAADGGSVAGISPTVTIARNDPVTYRIGTGSPVSSIEESGAPTQLNITVTLEPDNHHLSAPLTIPYSVAGTATEGVDYTHSGRVVIPSGETVSGRGGSSQIVLTITPDNLNEADETIIVTLLSDRATMPGGGAFGVHTAADGGDTPRTMQTARITDNDDVTASFASATATANEGASVTLQLNLDKASSADLTATYNVTAGGATSPGFTDPGGGSITIPAGQMSGTITLRIHTDAATNTGTGTLTVANTALSYPAGETRTSMLTAASDNAVVTVTFSDIGLTASVSTLSVAEGGNGAYTLRLASDPGAGNTVTVVPASTSTAVATVSPASVTFTSANFGTAQTITVTGVQDDNGIENTATISHTVTASGGGYADLTGPQSPVAVTVTDDDTPSVAISPTALNVPEGESAAYSVRLTVQPDGMGTVTVTATGAGSSTTVNAVSETLTFTSANWNVAQTVTVTSAEMAMMGQETTISHTVALANAPYGSTVTSLSADSVRVTITPPRTAEALHEAVLPEVARAVVGHQMAALADRVAAGGGGAGYGAGSFNLNGQSTLGGAAAANIRSLAGGDGANADLDMKELLRDMDFFMPLNAGHSGDGALGGMAFWGGSEYREFSGENGNTDWDGDMFNLHAGFDAKVRHNMLAGLMLSYSDAESDYSTLAGRRTETGDYKIELTTVSPYLNWDLAGGQAWVSVGYGSGEVEVRPETAGQPDLLNDVSMQNFGAGFARQLRRAGQRETRIKADVFIAGVEVKGAAGGIAEDIDADARRVRFAIESRRSRVLSGGAKLTPALDVGVRHDSGDGNTGGGLELGGALHYRDAARGLTVEGRARYLVGHSGDGTREWGIGGLARLEAGADGQGLSVSLAPSYGDADADAQDLWTRGVAAVSSADSDSADAADDLAMRLTAEVGYGNSAAGGLLTPYTAMRLGEAKRDYRLGLRWSAGNRVGLGLGIGLDLSARRVDADDAAADNIVALEGKLRF